MAPGVRGCAVVTCEHASNRIPRRYAGLGLPVSVLRSHIAWDPGAAAVARTLARTLGCTLCLGQYSRLLIDLNRSIGNPRLIVRRSFGVSIPGNSLLPQAERDTRIRRYYHPYRQRVTGHVRRVVDERGWCVHVSVHSFSPKVNGSERCGQVGLLYDPRRSRERALVLGLAHEIRRRGLHVRLNHPYRGTSDGLVAAFRLLFPSKRYVGLEIEVNQRLLRSPQSTAAIACLAASAGAALDEFARR